MRALKALGCIVRASLLLTILALLAVGIAHHAHIPHF